MEYFDFDSYRVRLIDQRPKVQAIQINIYNPADEGHSFASFVGTTEETPSDLTTVYNALVDENFMAEMLPKAETAFSSAAE